MIATLGCGLFAMLYGNVSYHLLCGLVFVVTTAVVIGISVVLKKYIEPLGNAGEAYVEGKIAGRFE